MNLAERGMCAAQFSGVRSIQKLGSGRIHGHSGMASRSAAGHQERVAFCPGVVICPASAGGKWFAGGTLGRV
jgi:hypothetical protein